MQLRTRNAPTDGRTGRPQVTRLPPSVRRNRISLCGMCTFSTPQPAARHTPDPALASQPSGSLHQAADVAAVGSAPPLNCRTLSSGNVHAIPDKRARYAPNFS